MKDHKRNNAYKKAGIYQTLQSLIEVSSKDGTSKGRKSLIIQKLKPYIKMSFFPDYTFSDLGPCWTYLVY